MKSIPRFISLTRLVLAGSAAVLLTPSLYAASFNWGNTATDFNDAASWVENQIPASTSGTLTFSGTPTFQPTLTQDFNLGDGKLDFTATAAGYNISSTNGAKLIMGVTTGNSTVLTATNTTVLGTTTTISADIQLVGRNTSAIGLRTFKVSDGSQLVLSGNISETSGTAGLSFSRNNGTGQISNLGAALVTISGSNSFSGGVTLSGPGMMYNIANANALGTGTLSILSTSGQEINNKTGSRLTISNSVAWVMGAGLNFGNTADFSGATTKVSGISSDPMDANVLFTGPVSLTGGAGSSTIYVQVAASTVEMSGIISQATAARSITKNGPGTLNISGTNNTFTGGVIITSGTLAVASIGSQASTASSLGAGSSALQFTVGSLVYTGVGETSDRQISVTPTGAGSVGFYNNGTGALVLNNLSMDATANKNLFLGGSNLNNNTIASAFKNSAGTTTLTKADAGKWILSGANNYTGVTTINGGTLQFAKKASLYNGDTAKWTTTNLKINNAGSTLALNVGGADEFSAADVGILLALNNSSFQAGTAFGFDTTNATGGSFTYDTAITNAGSNSRGITKLGSGILNLGGDNTYTGATRVEGGQLNVTGALAAGSAVSVLQGASLNVNGSIAGSVTIDGDLGGNGSIAGATLINGRFAPGNSIGTLATGDLTFGADSVFDIELGVSGDVAVSDQANVTGTVNILDGAALNLTLSIGTVQAGDLFFLINNDDTDDVTGTFVLSSALGGTVLTDGSQFSWNDQIWKISYHADAGGTSFINGNDVALMVVPEPSTWALLTGGLGMLVAMQGMRRRAKVS